MFIDTYTPNSKRIAIICIKQSDKFNGIYYFAQDLITNIEKNNSVTVITNDQFKNALLNNDKRTDQSSKKSFY